MTRGGGSAYLGVMERDLVLRIILWVSLILGGIVLAFVAWFLVAHLVQPQDNGSNSTLEGLSFAFFPVGLSVGLAVAYWRRGLGGAIALGSMIGLFILRPDLLGHGLFLVFVVPGLGYVLHHLLTRRMAD